MPEIPETYLSILEKLAVSLLVGTLVWLGQRLTRGVITRGVRDPEHGHTVRMLVRNTLYVVGASAILLTWVGLGSNFTVVMGILGAGIAFASQEMIVSFAGYLNIISSGLFQIGDRIRIGNVVGDVLDVGTLRTTVMEIGEWVRADQYSGRVVSVANRAVFSDPLFNYTQHWPYIWDEITIPITYASDWGRAEELMLQHGAEYSASFLVAADAELQEMGRRFPIQNVGVQPALYVVMTDNWVEMTLRYVVDPHERREVKGRLHRELLRHFESEPSVTVASATFEIVGVPPLRYVDRDTHSGSPV